MNKIFDYPIIRIHLERMQQEIVTALTEYNSEIATYVNEEIKKAIDNFDYEATVRELADKAIKDAVGAGVEGLIGWDLRREIENMVKEKIKAKINTEE